MVITTAVIATVVLCLWIAVIWGHSMMPGSLSSNESNIVAQLLKPLLIRLGVTSARMRTYVVRKCAHFTEYLILAMLSRHFVRARGLRFPYSAIVLGTLLAGTPMVDEFIQSFVPGRSSAVRDVCIDVAGGLTGHFLYQVGIWFQRARRRPSAPQEE